ncbi:MAG: glycosyltransferase family 4 protein [Desulfatibacillaceae bacterium]
MDSGKKKILVVSRCAWTLYNFRKGLIRALMDAGHEVVCAGAGGDGYDTRLLDEGFVFKPLPVDLRGINPVADTRLFASMVGFYRREAPDVVLHFTIKPVIYGSVAARLARVPRIINTITGLGYVFAPESPGWLRAVVTRLYRTGCACAHHTFFQNEQDKALFLRERMVSGDNIGVLPGSGVDTCRFSPPEREPTEAPVTFVMIARMLRDKGVYEFVEAARLVRERVPDTRFLLVGMRDERNPNVIPAADLEQWCAEGIVEWPGPVVDVCPVLAAAHVVVLPTYYPEGVPKSLLEAAAMARPVITTDTVGCRDAVVAGETGLLVPVRDAAALARAMEDLALDPKRRKAMGEAGRCRAVEVFDEKTVVARVLEQVGKIP